MLYLCCCIGYMCTEDSISAENERLWSVSTLQHQWEEEERQRIEDLKLNSTIDEEHARLSYMEAFYSSESSGGVLQYPWPTHTVATGMQQQEPADMNNQQTTSSATAANNNATTSTNSNSKAEYKYKEGYDIICSDFGNISTIHVNGLQRGQEVSMGGQKAEGSQAKAIASLAMRPAGTRDAPASGTVTAANKKKGSKGRNTSKGATRTLSSPRQGNVTPPSPTKQQQQSFDSYDQGWQEEGGDDGLSAILSTRQPQSPLQRTRGGGRGGGGGVNLLELGPRYVKGRVSNEQMCMWMCVCGISECVGVYVCVYVYVQDFVVMLHHHWMHLSFFLITWLCNYEVFVQ